MKEFRVALPLLFVVFLSTSVAIEPLPAAAKPFTQTEFSSLIERLCEQGGEFWNDNYVSNEASYQHPLKRMRELGINGGVYIGVGPNQNFTYIAKIRPRYAFIVDVRRQNMLQHLLFKALFRMAETRSQYLSLLLGRPVLPGNFEEENYTVQDLVRYFETAEPDPSFFSRVQNKAYPLIADFGLELSEDDWSTIHRIHAAFFARGLSIKYDYIPVPTYGEFLVEKDLDGNMQNFLNSEDDFQFIKKMEQENRIIPVVGDFSGPHTLRELGSFLRERNERVMVFYTSNVEQYLVRNMVWPNFVRNLLELPFDERAVFIRAHWSNYVPHPEEVEGYEFTQVLQRIKPFLHAVPANTSVTYWDIVTADTIKLR